MNSKLEIVATGVTGSTWRKSQEVDIPEAQAIVGAWGRCLDVDTVVRSPGNNPRATLSVCEGSPGQRWVRNGETIRNVVSGQCLNVENDRNRRPQRLRRVDRYRRAMAMRLDDRGQLLRDVVHELQVVAIELGGVQRVG